MMLGAWIGACTCAACAFACGIEFLHSDDAYHRIGAALTGIAFAVVALTFCWMGLQ